MTTLNYSRVLTLGLMILLIIASVDAGHKYEITGRVIARDAYLGLPRLSSAANVQILILKIGEAARDTKSPQFVKVRYEDFADKHPLSPDLLEGKSFWRFSLRRDRSCDQIVSEDLFSRARNSNEPPKSGTFILVQNANQKDIPPIHSTIPCFALRPGGVKPIASVN